MNRVALSVVASLAILALPFAAVRADRPPPRRPPQAAFDACAKAKQGDACTVALPDRTGDRTGDRTVAGTCVPLPDTAELVCRPEHPGGHRPGPPPEALSACSGKAVGDACSMTHEGRAIAGTCAAGPDGAGPLACRPSERPPR